MQSRHLMKMAFRSPPEFGLRNAIRLCRGMSTNWASGQRGTYRAAVCTEIGKPLQILEQERRSLEENQVRVAVKRCAINFADILIVQGMYQERPKMPFIPGNEISGEILEVGSSVKHLKPGDKVVGILSPSAGYAEEVVAADMLFHPINELLLDEGASTLVSYGTAEVALVRAAKIKESDFVLVTAAAGALGLAAVDLAANVFEANVIGACGGPEKAELVLRHGAKFTIDYKKENLRERVKEITQGRGVDIVFDIVGGKVLEEGLRCLATDGRLLVLGFAGGQIPKIPANLLLVKNISAHGVFWGGYSQQKPEVYFQSVAAVMKLWTEGKIKPHVGKIFPLSQVNEAFKYVSSRQSTGKVLLDCTRQ